MLYGVISRMLGISQVMVIFGRGNHTRPRPRMFCLQSSFPNIWCDTVRAKMEQMAVYEVVNRV